MEHLPSCARRVPRVAPHSTSPQRIPSRYGHQATDSTSRPCARWRAEERCRTTLAVARAVDRRAERSGGYVAKAASRRRSANGAVDGQRGLLACRRHSCRAFASRAGGSHPCPAWPHRTSEQRASRETRETAVLRRDADSPDSVPRPGSHRHATHNPQVLQDRREGTRHECHGDGAAGHDRDDGGDRVPGVRHSAREASPRFCRARTPPRHSTCFVCSPRAPSMRGLTVACEPGLNKPSVREDTPQRPPKPMILQGRECALARSEKKARAAVASCNGGARASG